MKSLPVFIALFAIAPLVFAETMTFPVKGMHCESCVKTVTEGVCDKLKSEVKSCEVKLTDPNKKTGEIAIIPMEGKTVDKDKVTSLVKKSGYTAGTPVAATDKKN